MARPKGSNSNAAERLLEAAGRSFRAGGYGGVGVDGLAREAGLTSGAFYAHFKSKTDAFRAVVQTGMQALHHGMVARRAEHGANWVPHFIDFYLTERFNCDLSSSCALQSLTGEVMRANDDTRHSYEIELEAVLEAMQAQPYGLDRARATALLVLLSGGVTMARATLDPEMQRSITKAVREAALRVAS